MFGNLATMVWRLSGALLVACLVVFLVACDPGHEITYVNETDQHITVRLNGGVHAELGPHETKDVLTLEFIRARTISAENEGGRVIYSETLTWGDLRDKGWKIVISNPD